ncbi:HlyD family efflux transporter periplasmic adaptor subunit [Corticibacter populi]|uniref:HlyD family efflux transporter periplasmic adaptor subunit n=1 Tax=Corticibacter populi TaxID=1550736 RepID=A0A3M6QHR0_9BURK|nr:HlyD family efflux transporter periplasmic adaptor subunit [Corticibacter populi]RMX02634.1 HlyD family efflux transporter periplasmic adaptor subunit [Corticibacter populi]RZS32948.1 membrane fusion protein (multidrug efflux system) [Corticibacter populi]
MSTSDISPEALQATHPAARRRRLLVRLTVLLVLAVVAWAVYEWLAAGRYESTDNAYVQGNLVQISPQMAGTVQSILADETDFVRAGQVLVQFDPADAELAYVQAEASLAKAVRDVRTLYANNDSLAAQVSLREAEVVRARNDVARAGADLRRRQSLTGHGAVSGEELSHAQSQLDAAQAALSAAQAGVRAAREQLTSNRALTDGVAVEQHPVVQVAAARLREAYLARQRTALLAPVDGYVAKRSVQIGQRVAAGAALLTVVPLHQLWVDANFKENQLRNLRMGQPVELVADLYGKDVRFQGVVQGLGIGTGAAFALLPAQNASGNWIKVVQRVPVRIALDAAELDEHPLRVGLSMDVRVDIRQQDGKLLADAPRSQPTLQTSVYAAQDEGAEAAVARVIAANLGRQAAPASTPASAAAGNAA